MPGQKGSFDKMLQDIQAETHSDKEVAPSPTKQSKTSPEAPTVKRMRANNTSGQKSVPFNQSVPVDVANRFYDIARAKNWTVSKTLTHASEALEEKLAKGKI